MSQNSMRLSWTFEEVDDRLKQIMKDIFAHSVAAADAYDVSGDYLSGANIAGFTQVADAMVAQGLV
jgi:glutamate dehydrogenase (NADP+)